MKIQGKFISATKDFSTLERNINAPYFRTSLEIKGKVKSAALIITGLGCYEAYVNGKNITKGFFAPYRSNPEHIVYFDKYEVSDLLTPGENVVAALLGNGFQNPLGAYSWDCDKASWVSAPKLCFELLIEYENGSSETVVSDVNTKTAKSPILFDDWHYGEYYDARLEIENWNKPCFDDSEWENAVPAETPTGDMRLCEAEPIVINKKIKPLSVTEYDGGYIYDFGTNNAGLCEMNIADTKTGQKVLLQYFEMLRDGKPFFDNFRFNKNITDLFQEDIYYCSGNEKESYLPHFTYHGFRYVYVTGIKGEQATKDLLTFFVMNSDIKQIGAFSCDNEVVNKLQEATVRSDFSNFYYYPTDCPQREKNGWTADASLSAEQMLLNLKPEKSYAEWMRNIYKAINEKGQLPGIVPTSGFGYDWGNGPAWDNVIVNLPYYTYIYRGDSGMFRELSEPLMRYLKYLETRLDENNLLAIGLGDWCQPDRPEPDYDTPLIVTDSILTVDIARKAAVVYEVLGQIENREFAQKLALKIEKAIKKHLINHEDMTVTGDTQTTQAMALFYGMFEEDEYKKALEHLLKLIAEKDGHFDVGVLGGKVIFRLLADNGYADLALDMIIRPDFPSYGNWIARGATTLWEDFRREGDPVHSLNHHFWGDVSAWFYTYLAGIRINPTGNNVNEVNIAPCFTGKLKHVKASHLHPQGEISVEWERVDSKIKLVISVPENINGKIILPENYTFDNGKSTMDLHSNTYGLIKKNA